MQTPVEIDFQGMTGTPVARDAIAKHIARLEQRYGRLTACRVVLKGPGPRHQTRGLYEINIHLVGEGAVRRTLTITQALASTSK
jgi:hypothetical protein